jgi:hypothetical protein
MRLETMKEFAPSDIERKSPFTVGVQSTLDPAGPEAPATWSEVAASSKWTTHPVVLWGRDHLAAAVARQVTGDSFDQEFCTEHDADGFVSMVSSRAGLDSRSFERWPLPDLGIS